MSQVAISGNASGTGVFTIAAPNSNVSYTSTLPAATGTLVNTTAAVSAAGQIPFSTDGSTYTATAKIVSGTAVASTSGTSIDFTGIPSWVKRITVMFSGVSTNGSSDPLVQIGSGSVTTTGYASSSSYVFNAAATSWISSTAGFNLRDANAAGVRYGSMVITNVSGNIWVATHQFSDIPNGVTVQGAGGITLGGTLDRVRITTTNGTDTFDAGSINLLWE